MADGELFKLPGEHVYEGMLLTGRVREEDIRRIPDLDLSGDVVVVGYPKTGSIWTKQLVWLLLHDADTEAAAATPIHIRTKFLEFLSPLTERPTVDIIPELPHPRLMHSHLRPSIFTNQLAEGTKFVVVVRNPKDTLVSYYNFYKSNVVLGCYTGSWDDFFEMAKKKRLSFGDYFDFYMDWLPHRGKDNVYFIFFEDMKQDLETEVRKLADFLGTTLSDEKVQKVLEFLQFDNMKKREVPTGIEKTSFYRKGQVGDWRNHFSEAQSEFIDSRYRDTLEKAGLTLRF